MCRKFLDSSQNVQVLPLAASHLDAAFELATDVFVTSSSLHRALGISLDAYRTYLRPNFERMVAENLSVVALDPVTQALAGCLIATDLSHHVSDDVAPSAEFAPLAALTQALTSQYLEGRELVAGQVMLVDMAAVIPAFQRRGVYGQMRATAQMHAKRKGFTHVEGELSSTATQKAVLTRLGHQKRAEVRFEQFGFGCTKPFASITSPPSLILAEGKL